MVYVNHPKIILLGLLLTLTISPLTALNTEQEYIDQAEIALEKENYQEALKILEEGKKTFPKAHILRSYLGDIYSQRRIYSLALEEYREALLLDPANYQLNFSVAETLGLLNKNTESIAAFEETLDKFPEDAPTVQALAWMYFKVEDYEKGVSIVQQGIKTLGGNRSFYMTLGTLYSSLYEYKNSKEAYLDSIRRAELEGDTQFASIAYYNLSILETSFLKFQEAYDAVETSLKQDQRPSGYLALGELLQTQMNFKRAVETFDKADLTETTPLTKMDLAKIYRQFGFLDQALAYLLKVEANKDDSWMYNFGVTADKWKMDIHQTYGEIYRGYGAEADFTPRFWPWEWAGWVWKKVTYGFQAWYHEQIYKDLQYRLAEDSLGRSNNPMGWWNIYKASENYPFVARKYLSKAREFEEARIPGVTPLYQLEEGKLERRPDLLAQALEQLDPKWMGLERTEAILALIPQVTKPQQRALLNQLYQINPGSLRQAGWSLPLQVNVYGSNPDLVSQWTWDLEGWIRATGHDASLKGEDGRDYQLNINVGTDGMARFSLKDKEGLSLFQDFEKVEDRGKFFEFVFTRVHRVN